ncbi:MAG: AAA family ATPase [Lachnospiraceae bacterium]
MFPLVIKAMQTGGTLVVDEFDASIHPMALMSIINVFHNDDVNIHHAQLIFNTHNPIFLEFKSYSEETRLSLLSVTMIHMTAYYMHYLILVQRVIRVFVSTKII